ncbi:hypothetical protein TorRG33x02_322740 [Trema orientale]|uniref:Uncharacterized protein n=1 Tax=Trema orientale TaxID=63057 RepID=A0A2P5BFN4_TREOI|nr:hypothetical protein TorRG33x02_322740 [Trema orientale]
MVVFHHLDTTPIPKYHVPPQSPQIRIDSQNPISKNIECFAKSKLFSFGIVGEVCVQDVPNIQRITSNNKVHIRKPRAFELKCATIFPQKLMGDKVMEESEIVEKRWQHANDRPGRGYGVSVPPPVVNHNEKAYYNGAC